MSSKFFNLEKEKQDRILNAAIKEFAQKGFDNASTNEMVKEAGISKGLLFHYFKNKKQLYLFLYDHFLELIVTEIFGRINFEEKDFFVRIHQTTMIKMELLHKYPTIFKFMENVYMEDSVEVKQELEKRKKEFMKINTNKFFEGIDTSLFKEDLDIQKVLKIFIWTFEKLVEEELNKAKLTHSHEIDYEHVFRVANEYLEIFTKCFYKS